MKRNHHQKTQVLAAGNRFIGDDAKAVARQARAASENGIQEIILDFENAAFVDSAALGVMVSLVKELRTNKADLILRNLDAEIMDLFEETGLDAVFTIERPEGVVRGASDLFNSAVDIKLGVAFQSHREFGVLELSGVMNHPMGSRYFKQQFLLAMASARKICVDCNELTFFDSLSVSVLLSMHKLLTRTGGAMRLCRPNYIVKDLFATLSIDSIIPVYDSRDKALADWGGE
jgi:anti-sigma B factor antagonist